MPSTRGNANKFCCCCYRGSVWKSSKLSQNAPPPPLLTVNDHPLMVIICVISLISSYQTKLHESVCDQRTLATIATHDLSSLVFPLEYEAVAPGDIELLPLGKHREISAEQLITDLRTEALKQKQKTKRNPFKSGLYKYVTAMICLQVSCMQTCHRKHFLGNNRCLHTRCNQAKIITNNRMRKLHLENKLLQYEITICQYLCDHNHSAVNSPGWFRRLQILDPTVSPSLQIRVWDLQDSRRSLPFLLDFTRRLELCCKWVSFSTSHLFCASFTGYRFNIVNYFQDSAPRV